MDNSGNIKKVQEPDREHIVYSLLNPSYSVK